MIEGRAGTGTRETTRDKVVPAGRMEAVRRLVKRTNEAMAVIVYRGGFGIVLLVVQRRVPRVTGNHLLTGWTSKELGDPSVEDTQGTPGEFARASKQTPPGTKDTNQGHIVCISIAYQGCIGRYS